MNASVQDYCRALEILGVSTTATDEEVKTAYRDGVLIWHPDRFGANPRLRTMAEEKLKEINWAWGVLSNSDWRRHVKEEPPDQKSWASPKAGDQDEAAERGDASIQPELRAATWRLLAAALIVIVASVWAAPHVVDSFVEPGPASLSQAESSPSATAGSKNDSSSEDPDPLSAGHSEHQLTGGAQREARKHVTVLNPRTGKEQTFEIDGDAPTPEELAAIKMAMDREVPQPAPEEGSAGATIGAGEFTTGSSEAQVLFVMGTPTSRQNVMGQTWLYYGLSRVVIEDGAVTEYDNRGNLKIKEAPKQPVKHMHFSLGSSEDQVISAMGTPTSRQNVMGQTWLYYGFSRVVLEGGAVTEYDNRGNLKIR
jgi:curved DNA-binding protein CbpA/outer membrane protein assembly factor BamE (lipoprotein component of BamABCDE complex)